MARTAGVINASDIGIYVDVSGTDTKIATITSATLSLTHSPRVTTNFDSGGWETRAKGKKEWEISGNSLFAFDADYGFAELYALYNNGTQVKLKWKTENGDFSDNDVYTGLAYISQLSATGSTEENETYSFSFAGTGEIGL